MKKTPPLRTLALGALALPFLACTSPPPPRPRPAVTDMHVHLRRTGEIRDAVIAGEVDRMRDAARWVATHDEPPGLSRELSAYGAEVRSLAARLVTADSLEEAARIAARMGASCGRCHVAGGVPPRFAVGLGPPEGERPSAQMNRHVWASDRMWEGLVGPSQEAWEEGIRALQAGWINPPDVVGDPRNLNEVRALVRRVYALAAEGKDARTLEERARIYGRFLATCIECHELVGTVGGGA